MASRCNCCARPVEITEASRLRTVVYADPRTDAPYLYAALWECRCQNTLAAVLWEDEESALDSHAAEQAEADACKVAPVEPLTAAFFSLTHELAELVL